MPSARTSTVREISMETTARKRGVSTARSAVVRRQRQARALDQQTLRGPFAGGAVEAFIGNLVAPGSGLRAHVVERRERAAIEEGVADEFDRGFHPPFELRVADGGRGGLEEVVPGEGEEARIELHRRADVVEHR